MDNLEHPSWLMRRLTLNLAQGRVGEAVRMEQNA